MARWIRCVGWVGGLGGVFAAVAWACLPNLIPNLCGNGVIDVAAGETCDPGANPTAYPGCDAVCQVVCSPVTDGGASYYDNPFSNHCYLTPRRSEGNATAAGTCGVVGAHLVTFVDDDELEKVNKAFTSHWPQNPRYWVGLESETPNGAYFAPGAVEPFEPGWRPVGACSGCFLHGTPGNELPVVDGGVEAGPANDVIATDLDNAQGTMAVMGARARAEVVCEREPPGSRSTPCLTGEYCFTVLASLKSYVFNPTPLLGEAAEAACHALTDAGTASLVVFDTRAEREQVVYELTQLSTFFPGIEVAQFWIGVSLGVAGQDADIWVWDDGTSAVFVADGGADPSSRPLVWGDHQPVHVALPARAYIQTQQDGRYDNGLAQAASEAVGIALPSVCQY